MKLFLIEAYGGPAATDGKVEHFTVRASSLDEAIALVRQSAEGSQYRNFDLVEERAEFPAEEPGILESGEGSFLES